MEWITSNWETIAMYIAGAIPVIVALVKSWKKYRSVLKLAEILYDAYQHMNANDPENIAHARKKQVESVIDTKGLRKEADKVDKHLKQERIRRGNSKDSTIQLGADIDEEGNWQAKAGWRFEF